MSQPHMLCPNCLHALGAKRILEDILLVCRKCNCWWEFDDEQDRWYKYFDFE